MYSRDIRDICAGLFVGGIGLFIAVNSAVNYKLGTLKQLGVGGFPFGLGIILLLLGLLILVPALLRPGTAIKVEFARPAIIIAGMAAFALLVKPFGMIPAVIALIVVSSLADRPVRPGYVAGSSIVLSALIYLLFRVGLNQPLVMLNWPL